MLRTGAEPHDCLVAERLAAFPRSGVGTSEKFGPIDRVAEEWYIGIAQSPTGRGLVSSER